MGNQFSLIPIPGLRKHLETRPLSVGLTCMLFAELHGTSKRTADRYQRGLDLSDRESDRVGDREGFRPTLGKMVGGIPWVCTPTLAGLNLCIPLFTHDR